jgi:hypothetical protein
MSIAKKMSWAADRQTTRAEDVSYSLLGLFDVNMPLLYGEGQTNAFSRLQEEIMKKSTDQSIFAWKPIRRAHQQGCVGILAAHPMEFSSAANVVPIPDHSEAFQMTNKGLRIQIPLLPTPDPEERLAILGCHIEDNFDGPLALRLLQDVEAIPDIFVRAGGAPEIIKNEEAGRAVRETVYVLRDHVQDVHFETVQFLLRSRPQSLSLAEAFPSESWNQSTGVMQFHDSWPHETRAALTFAVSSKRSNSQYRVAMVFGVFQRHEHFFVNLRRVSPGASKDEVLGLANVYTKRAQSKDISTITLDDDTLTVRMVRVQIMGKPVHVLELESDKEWTQRRKEDLKQEKEEKKIEENAAAEKRRLMKLEIEKKEREEEQERRLIIEEYKMKEKRKKEEQRMSEELAVAQYMRKQAEEKEKRKMLMEQIKVEEEEKRAKERQEEEMWKLKLEAKEQEEEKRAKEKREEMRWKSRIELDQELMNAKEEKEADEKKRAYELMLEGNEQERKRLEVEMEQERRRVAEME